jgi:hypothetical protein
LSYFLDPDCPEYKYRWQVRFSLRRKRLGPCSALHAQRYVSKVRAMRRSLAAGGKPSLLDFRSLKRAGVLPFKERRINQRFKRAVRRGETQRSLARRGFFGSLKQHQRLYAR